MRRCPLYAALVEVSGGKRRGCSVQANIDHHVAVDCLLEKL